MLVGPKGRGGVYAHFWPHFLAQSPRPPGSISFGGEGGLGPEFIPPPEQEGQRRDRGDKCPCNSQLPPPRSACQGEQQGYRSLSMKLEDRFRVKGAVSGHSGWCEADWEWVPPRTPGSRQPPACLPWLGQGVEGPSGLRTWPWCCGVCGS